MGLAWVVLPGFLRIATSPRFLPAPLTPEQALSVVEGRLARPPVVAVSPGPEHWRVLRNLIRESGTAGKLSCCRR